MRLKKEKAYSVAIAGATGLVGQEVMRILEQREFPIAKAVLLASGESAGERMEFCEQSLRVEELDEKWFEGIDIAFFCVGTELSEQYAPRAAKKGCVVIDNSNAFRMKPDVPLVVPEVNPDAVDAHKGLIANPNCSTIQMVVALKPLHDIAKIKRVVVSTYQSVSGWGKGAIDELAEQVVSIFNQRECKPTVFPHQIAFNCLPQIDVLRDSGVYKEEEKMVNETKKILDPKIEVFATCVRVPVFHCHAEAVSIEFQRALEPGKAKEILRDAPGVTVLDEPEKSGYPTQFECAGTDDVWVGRIRKDPTVKHGLGMWIVSDNLRKGAALNAVQIAELLLDRAK